MVTRDDLEQLVKNRGQEAVGAAVVKIPDEDVRPALMLMVMIYQKHRLTRAHREKQLKMSCQALHNAPPNRT